MSTTKGRDHMELHSASAPEPSLFTLERLTDSTGISATGRVLDGVVFHTGQVVVCWRSDLRQPPAHSSIAVYPSVRAFLDVHVAPHGPAASKIRMLHGRCSELEALGSAELRQEGA